MISSVEDVVTDKFPRGIRVLAVDDDTTCLTILENILRKCQYEVTVTNKAVTALKMLQENRNNFDLVISDVRMPDMDGFKLLELVGLQMDLPVIMLSSHGDTKLVMKGITHGACDYLLKPVRIEELRNIWQHVIRRKKVDPKDQNKWPNQENAREVGQLALSRGNSDQNGQSFRKRKDQDGDQDEDVNGGDDGHRNEDSTTQKKPRVVWSTELKMKFAGAVNQLGIDKAVPKKILELMNVEGLTRENVASQLQKFRLCLKRLGNRSPQDGVVAMLGSRDSSYLRINGTDGFGDLRPLSCRGRLSGSALSSSYVPGSMLGRLNSTAGFTMREIASSGMLQSGDSQSFNSSFNTIGKIQQAMSPANGNSHFFQEAHTSLELNQRPQSKYTSHIGFTDARALVGSLGSSVSTSSSNLMMLQANPHHTQSRDACGNQSSLCVASLNQEPFDVGFHYSSDFLDHSRCNESWHNAVELSKLSSTSLPLKDHPIHDQMPPNNLSNTLSSSSCLDIRGSGLYCQPGPIGNHIQKYNQNSACPFTNVNSLHSGNPMDQSHSPYVAEHTRVEKAPLVPKLSSNDDFLFDDMMLAAIREDSNETILMEEEQGIDAYSLSSCI